MIAERPHRDIAGDGDVAGGLADLVELVDVDNPALCGFDVEISGLEELEKQVLDVLTDVTGFGKRGRVADGEGDLEHPAPWSWRAGSCPTRLGR